MICSILLERYTNIDERYSNANIEEKMSIIGSMYPENICFDGRQHRTARVSEPLAFILLINWQLQIIKKGKKFQVFEPSPQVARRESNHPITILKINNLQNLILACSPECSLWATMVKIKVRKNGF
jgi:hypothetical protein